MLPLAWLGGWLSVPLLLVVAAAAGVATVFATLAEQALVPELVAPPDRREANATKSSHRSRPLSPNPNPVNVEIPNRRVIAV